MRSQFQPIMGGVGGRTRIADDERHHLAAHHVVKG